MKRTTLLIGALALAVIATATPAFAMRDPGPGPMPGSGMGLYQYGTPAPGRTPTPAYMPAGPSRTGMALYSYGARQSVPSFGRHARRRAGALIPPRIGQAGLNNQYADGMNLYQYVRSNPINRRDWTGLESECYCGPDVTGFLVDLVNHAGKWRVKQGAISRAQGIAWLTANGMNLDWWSTAGSYKTKRCPSKGKPCQNTYWLCGECVHDHWIGNFMYGYLGRLLSIPDIVMDAAGEKVQGPGVGDDPKLSYSDPPWDTAGYRLARLMYDELTNPKGKREVCAILKSNMGHWNTANNTTPPPPKPKDIGWMLDVPPGMAVIQLHWPSPHASGYQKCKKCPEDLPAGARSTVPGGKFAKGFPNVK
jgi:hypothetical protein